MATGIIADLYIKDIIAQTVERQVNSAHHEQVGGQVGVRKEQVKRSRGAT